MLQEFRHQTLTAFAGLPVFAFRFTDPGQCAAGEIPEDVAGWAWRIEVDDPDEGEFAKIFELFLNSVDTTRVKALILGCWFEDYDPSTDPGIATSSLLASAERFPALEALFVGDMDSSQTEVSWIAQSDPGPLLAAFPDLRVFGLRGTSELKMAPLKHEALRELTFQGGGLPSEVARAISASELPSLTGLELYLGERWYNGDSTPADYAPILEGRAFPALRHLGLRDATIQDEIAAAIAHAPVVAQLESLDLSLGNLSDEGASALLAGQPLTHLKSLDLHHHFLSEEMMQRIWAVLPGVQVNLNEQETPDIEETDDPDDPDAQVEIRRYIAVAE